MEQEQNTQGAAPDASTPFQKSDAGESESSLMLVGACAVVLALVLLGWYMMKQTQMEVEVVPMMETTAVEQAPVDEAASADAAVAAFETQGSSDEVAEIEADLESTDFSSLDDTDQI
jgi:cytoskeletal protein RodZ